MSFCAAELRLEVSARMTTYRESPGGTGQRAKSLEALLAAMGVSDDPFASVLVEQGLDQIDEQYRHWNSRLENQLDVKLVRRYRAALTKLQTRTAAMPDHFFTEIERAYFARSMPDADEETIRAAIVEFRSRRPDTKTILLEHGLDVDYWLAIHNDTYKKRFLRKLVTEPFLLLMAKHEIKTSRKQRPRKLIFARLFDWLGIEKKFRPSDANINKTAKDLGVVAAITGNSKAKRRVKN